MRTEMNRPLEFLRIVPLFKGLSDEALTTLAANVPILEYGPGDTIILEGTIADTLYVIARGSVEVSLNVGSFGQRIVSVLTRRKVFGEMGVLEKARRAATVTAREERTVVHAIHSSDLHRLFKTMPEQYALLILNIARLVSSKLRGSRHSYGYSMRPEPHPSTCVNGFHSTSPERQSAGKKGRFGLKTAA